MNTVGKHFFKMTMLDVPLDGKTVLVRADYNVPQNDDGSIANDFRIRASLPTIQNLVSRGCKVVIISHLGRPEGHEKKFSLEPAAERLASLLKRPVHFVNTCIGHRVQMAVKRLPKGSVIVLENLRFHPEEEANDTDFAAALAHDSGASYFVQDGFGVVHRAHASTSAITQYLPSVAGLLLEKEYTTITNAMSHPKRPLLAILGGAKVSDKIAVVDALIKVADQIVIGGAMANTFLAEKGLSVGKSKVETDQFDVVKKIEGHAARKVGADAVGNYVILPSDVAVSEEVSADVERRVVAVDRIGENDRALDIGDRTIERFAAAVARAQTIIWNGTMGMAELPPFAHGSARLALELAEHPEKTSIIGGGDTADFVLNWDARGGASFTHVSTGGGASLELMAGEKLPGIEALIDSPRKVRYTKGNKA